MELDENRGLSRCRLGKAALAGHLLVSVWACAPRPVDAVAPSSAQKDASTVAAPVTASAAAGHAGAGGSTADGAAKAPTTSVRATEVALRAHLDSMARRQPNYDAMIPELAEAVRSQPGVAENVAQSGAVQSIVYKGPAPRPGIDVFEVTWERGLSEWHIGLGPDGKTSLLFVRRLEKPPETAPTRAELAAQMKERVESAVAADQFSGTVAITKEGQVLFEAAYGLADRAAGVRNELDTKFRIGSMNKMFTAVSVLQLVQAGAISLDDTVGKHLTQYPNADVASKVTIEHLLLHTGGTGDIFGPEYEAHRLELQSLEDYVRLYGQRAPQFEPGSRFAYSNYGFVLLGLVIAKASGKSYYDYVREKVFRPAGMKDTDSPKEAQVVAKRSRGYMRGPDGQLRVNDDTLPPRPTSAGGGLSTVGDLQRFARALLDGRLLSKDYMTILLEGRVTPNGERRPGFFNVGGEQPRSFGHGGGAPGMNGELRIFPDAGYVIAVLSNLDPPAASSIASFAGVRVPTDAAPLSPATE